MYNTYWHIYANFTPTITRMVTKGGSGKHRFLSIAWVPNVPRVDPCFPQLDYSPLINFVGLECTTPVPALTSIGPFGCEPMQGVHASDHFSCGTASATRC
jgi:hypothetical protein